MIKGEPVPFFGWVEDKDDTEAMLREQIHAQQHEINKLKQKLMDISTKNDFDMDGRC
jgi:hypothetical protein